jgi:hypothetical protein
MMIENLQGCVANGFEVGVRVDEPGSRRVGRASGRNRATAAMPALLLAACFFAFTSGCGTDPGKTSSMTTPVRAKEATSPYLNTKPGVAYVGDASCLRCHAELGRTFAMHPMGRSASEPAGVKPDVNGKVFEAAGLVYSIDHRNGRVFHRSAPLPGEAGAYAEKAVEAEVRFVIGSGTRGYSFVVEKADGLYQSPIAWYEEAKRWDLAPGYRVRNQNFDRRITTGCLFCHVNRLDPIEGKPPVIHGLSIGCERCHGPGELHGRSPRAVPEGNTDGNTGKGKDLTIVNPAHLEPPTLREAVCEQCHYQGTERINMPGRTESDFRPGLPLDMFLTVFSSRFDPSQRGQAVGQVEEMRMSRCFRESSGKLGCVSCHDPHRLPDPSEKVAYYRGRCLECHEDPSCRLPQAVRLERSPADDCVSCHMPRYPSRNIAHTSQTNHTIPRLAMPAERK